MKINKIIQTHKVLFIRKVLNHGKLSTGPNGRVDGQLPTSAISEKRTFYTRMPSYARKWKTTSALAIDRRGLSYLTEFVIRRLAFRKTILAINVVNVFTLISSLRRFVLRTSFNLLSHSGK